MKEFIITINNHKHKVIIKKLHTDIAIVEVNGKEFEVGIEHKFKKHLAPLDVKPVRKSEPIIDQQKKPSLPSPPSGKEDEIVAPLPGLILTVLVKIGDKIRADQTLIKMEAMKMENEIKADRDGRVKELFVKEGDTVLENTPLIKIGE